MKRYIALLLASVLVMALPVSAEGSYDWPFIEKIPIDSTYTQQAEHRGRVEKLTYTTHSYALEAVEKYGAWKGGWLALRRILRCNPFHRQKSIQYDPVP